MPYQHSNLSMVPILTHLPTTRVGVGFKKRSKLMQCFYQSQLITSKIYQKANWYSLVLVKVQSSSLNCTGVINSVTRLAKFHHVGKILKVFGYIFEVRHNFKTSLGNFLLLGKFSSL